MNIVFIGCGNMGGAIVSGMLESKNFQANQITAVLPNDSPDISRLTAKFNINVKTEYPKTEKVDAVVVAVKPQILDDIMPEYSAKIHQDTLVISICAGKTIEYFSRFLEPHAIVRTMPNLNGMVGYGSTVGCVNKAIYSDKKKIVEDIFNSVGSYTWVNDEKLIDPVTAISGSGPAYYFLFTELLAQAGEKLGLPSDLAQKLARETFIGAGAVLKSNDEPPSELRKSVTSPGGTTEAALKTFTSNSDLKKLIEDATFAAKKRGEELSS